MANLSFNLSPADLALFEGLQRNALLPELSKPGEGELVKLYVEKKKEEEKKYMAPYADLLEAEILSELALRKETIQKKLKDSEGSSFTVELFSWNTVYYRESLQDLKRRQSSMTADELREHHRVKHDQEALIQRNGWLSTFGTTVNYIDEDGYAQTYYGHYPVKVDRIFRNSDLQFRISLALGPNFYPFIRNEYVGESNADYGDTEEFRVMKKTLCLRYFPFGVSQGQMARILEVVKAKNKRSAEGMVVTLGEATYSGGSETILGTGVKYAFGLDPVDVDAGHHCFCGCEDDEE